MSAGDHQPDAGLPDAARRPRRKDVTAHPLGDEILIYTPATANAFSLNHSARAVWDFCDGRRTVAEISQELAQVYDRSPDDLLADVRAIVGQLRDLDILDLQ